MLQGNTQTKVNNTIIYCTRSAHVLINGSDDIVIKYLIVNKCGVSQGKDSLAALAPLITLHTYNCSFIALEECVFVCQ